MRFAAGYGTIMERTRARHSLNSSDFFNILEQPYLNQLGFKFQITKCPVNIYLSPTSIMMPRCGAKEKK
jgi:hypothetical protein